jgi:DNA-binding LacI/PurR family transcriptional regulator
VRAATAVRSARVTINQVAERAGVSRQTVSNALNYPERVHPTTLTKVRDVIDGVGYRPSASARHLKQQRAGAVGIELNALGLNRNDVAHPFVVALTAASPTHHCHLVPFASHEPSPMVRGYENMVRSHLVDAFVIAETRRDDPRPTWLDARSIPWVAFGRLYDDPTATNWADVDGRAGTAAAVEHLVERGYRRIGYLGWPAGSPVGDDRHAGWRDATRRHRLDPGPEAMCEQDVADATSAAEGVLDSIGEGGAVVCASDALALGVLHAALGRGWRAGHEVGIVGFDGSAMAEMSGLTTVVQPLDDIANHLLALVHDLLAGGKPPASGELFKPSIHIGASTHPSKKG